MANADSSMEYPDYMVIVRTAYFATAIQYFYIPYMYTCICDSLKHSYILYTQNFHVS